MDVRKILFHFFFLFCAVQSLCEMSLAEHFKQVGYAEICNNYHGAESFDSLYAYFDEMIEFLQSNPIWFHKLYSAKERFIRSKDRSLYSTDFFGFYDESHRKERNQIAFYYSIHFHDFICAHYPEFNRVPPITNFLNACCEIQKPYGKVFQNSAAALDLKSIFSSNYDNPPILLKVIKYLPSYNVTKPHYDGTAFSLFLDSTDNQSLLLSPYKSTFTSDDFVCPLRKFSRGWNQNSMLLIPGAHLTEYSIYPTPHIVLPSGKTRYATIAFAMRPHHVSQKNELSTLPNLIIE